jgi:hypothetical protein
MGLFEKPDGSIIAAWSMDCRLVCDSTPDHLRDIAQIRDGGRASAQDRERIAV